MESADAFRMTDRLHAEQGRGDPFAGAVRATRMPMVISDPRQTDNPLVFANDAFLALTGYERSEVLGQNCRFLQGPLTDEAEIGKIRRALREKTDVRVEMLNYRKDGSTFWNNLYLSPVFGDSGELQFYFASQLDVSDRKQRELKALEDKDFFENAVRDRTRELQLALEQKTLLLHEVDHRVKNNLQMISAMIRAQVRVVQDLSIRETLLATNLRIETLGTVHRRLYESNDVAEFELAGFLRETVGDLIEAAGHLQIRTSLELEEIVVPSSAASALALLLNELITNALKHAFPHDRGRLSVRATESARVARVVIEDDGVGMSAQPGDKATFGHKLVGSLVRQIRGRLTIADASPGTRVTIEFPLEKDAGEI